MNSSAANEVAEPYLERLMGLCPTPHDVKGHLEEVSCDVAITDTNTHAHCYFISLDGNKRPRVNDFARFISDKIIDFAIPRNEILQAQKELEITRSAASFNRLANKARHLFTRVSRSGEGGEVILSVLAESLLGLPQLLTKMAFKTNTQVHIHGSDGIHAGVNKEGHLALSALSYNLVF